MTTFWRFRPDDLNRFSKCNLDSLVETYELGFYLQYHAKWPSLFQVCEDSRGNIIGYIMGKVESSPDAYELSEHYLPWHAHITAFTVAPEARRLGVGKILVEQVETAADAGNAWFVDLFVRRSNEVAIAFYKSAGYSVFSRGQGLLPRSRHRSNKGDGRCIGYAQAVKERRRSATC